ncbi:D-alanyl-D-alanine carboxypeptidase (penicillin-binding protein 5/6) [Alicyclobacillus hesperidum]|uniref:D-alanyl-D-alanine carboxypeptidase (Penicillin-binding protein 5/6) n=1 Tax=Alicyclobacillus hesperidum TaxID=89784 RepID=A0A1H2YG61_9BACL|nr:D-alanyl-D-alanine carboxypeptidase [Alicyclobacillus hesperidum]SDX04147.1 D-alanyl-D-alanine carboxypeptidase (penicillin-binding protein 5/6) [Alicyclobacillus hesperidum]
MNQRVERSQKGRHKPRIGAAFVGILVMFGLMITGFKLPLLPVLQGDANTAEWASYNTVHHVLTNQPSLPSLTGVAWPQSGQAAVMIDGHLRGHYGANSPIPIASLTKMMTAFVVLQKYPLGPNESGPTYTVTPQDVQIYNEDYAENDSCVNVVAGETLTERQMLEGLLLPSGDNMAVMLANWVSGSVPSFVNQMNTEAHRLGMTNTYYADPAGVSAQTVSTALDQLKVSYAVMKSPTIQEIVGMTSAPFPLVGQINNTNSDLGQDGITGLKTGNLEHIGNMAVAADRVYDHKQVEVIAVVLGQPGANETDSLSAALKAGRSLIQSLGTPSANVT